jgi:hypothetical protein
MHILIIIGFLIMLYALIKGLSLRLYGDYFYQGIPLGTIGLMTLIVGAYPDAMITISILLVLSVMLLTMTLYALYKLIGSLLYGDIEWTYLSIAAGSSLLLMLVLAKGIYT